MLSMEEMILVWTRVVVTKTDGREEIQKIFRSIHWWICHFIRCVCVCVFACV